MGFSWIPAYYTVEVSSIFLGCDVGETRVRKDGVHG